MDKYIDADKLKAEIERRNLSNYHTTTEGYEEELYEIIDSLQQEQPEVGVENYIQSYLESIGFGYGGWVDGLRDEDLKKIARHFYKLGLNARKEE